MVPVCQSFDSSETHPCLWQSDTSCFPIVELLHESYLYTMSSRAVLYVCNASVGVAHDYNYDLCAKSYFLVKCFNIWIIFVKNIISCKTWCNQQSVVSIVYIVWVSWKKWVAFALLILTSTAETIKTIVGENDVSELVVTDFVVDKSSLLERPSIIRLLTK